MSKVTENVELVAQWRNDAGSDNPAGPLFGGDQFAEADIIRESAIFTLGRCGTACTGSYTRYCC